MAVHLADQVARRHEEYLRVEVASLRRGLTEAEDKLRHVSQRLASLEAQLADQGLIRSA